MYKLYRWNPWNFGEWIYKGEFATKKELNEQIKNKSQGIIPIYSSLKTTILS